MEIPPSPGQASPAPADPEAPAGDEGTSAATEPAPQASPATKETKTKKKKGTLRERVAQDREIERLRQRELLILKLPLVVGILVILGVLAFVFRTPILRTMAHTDGSARDWAVSHLASMRDAGSFAIYVEQLGRDNDTQTFNELVFLGAGRKSIPPSGVDPQPEDPETVATHQTILLEALGGQDADMRRGALYALWTLQQRTWTREAKVLQAVAKLLDPPCDDAVARRYAALVLKASPAPEITHAALLRAALKDDDRMTRRHAVEAVGNSLDPRLGARLLPALEDPFPEIRRQASLALSRLQADVPLGTLEAIYRGDQPAVQSEVLEAIAARPEDDVVPILIEGLSAHVPTTRRVAVLGLAKRRGTHVVRGLRDAVADKDPYVRLAAIEALGAREDAKAVVPSLVDALRRHEGWQEIRALHRALVALTGAQVSAPTPLAESWSPCIAGWDAYLEESGQ